MKGPAQLSQMVIGAGHSVPPGAFTGNLPETSASNDNDDPPSSLACFEDDVEACMRICGCHSRTERRRLKVIFNGFGKKPALGLTSAPWATPGMAVSALH